MVETHQEGEFGNGGSLKREELGLMQAGARPFGHAHEIGGYLWAQLDGYEFGPLELGDGGKAKGSLASTAVHHDS
ncbi:hypothetical protein Dimus_012939 [Dionaea muscipula]